MANDYLFYRGFISAIRHKISHKATLANKITDLLDIDKDAVYRRLRGEVSFTFTEMALIARNLGISLDIIAGIETEQSKPARMNISKHVNPTEADYEMFSGHVELLKSIKDEPDTKIMEAANMFPHYLYGDYEYLTRYYLFKWNQSSSYGDALPFHEITISEKMRDLQKQSSKYARYISSTLYVWDHLIFQRLVTNIKYFARVRLIKEEDVSLIKNDLTMFVDHLENMATKGKHEETGKEVSIYISDVDCDTNYSCLKSKYINLTLFKAFMLNATVTFDEEVFNETCTWIRSLQRMSTLISVSGEKIRAMYFDEQRKIIHTI
jgi:hypothetical protein